MLTLRLANLVKFLIGILIVQGVTVLLVVTAQRTSLEHTALLFVMLNVSIGVLTALWFSSIADAAGRQALARAKEGFSREREKLRVRAEQEKSREVRNTQRQVEREKRRAQTSTHLKNGVMIGGAVGVGAVMLLTQFVTLGLLTLTTAGGAALGYGLRARQERLASSGRGLLGGAKEIQVIAAPAGRESLPPPREPPKPVRGA